MYNLNKDYPDKCNIVYIPRSDAMDGEKLSHMDIIEHETHDSRYDTTPMGISELDDLL